MVVSAIIPAYNAASTVARAVESVLAQTEPVGEIIVVNDGSTDETLTSLVRFGSGVRVISQRNQGVSAARNAGLEAAIGDVIMFLDADDEWLPTKVAIQTSLFQSHPEIGMVAGRYLTVLPDGTRLPAAGPTRRWCGRVLPPGDPRAFDLAVQISTITVAVRRAVLPQPAFDIGLRTAEDRDLWFRLLLTVPAWVAPDSVAVVHPQPWSLSREDPDTNYSTMLALIDRHASQLSTTVRTRHIDAVLSRWCGVLLSRGDRNGAQAVTIRRLRNTPMNPRAWYQWLRCRLPARVDGPWALERRSPMNREDRNAREIGSGKHER